MMAEFETVARAPEVTPGEMKLVEVDGDEVVIANVDGAPGTSLKSSARVVSVTRCTLASTVASRNPF